jgi:thiamine biosynthesis lipoprotein
MLRVSALLLLAGLPPAGPEPLVSLRGETQGTTYHVRYHDARQRRLKAPIDSILNDVEACLSTYRPDSELSQFNRATTHRFRSPHFYPVLAKSADVFRATHGAFDPTVLPLVEAYGFGPTRARTDEPVNVDSLLQFVGFQRIAFDSVSVRKPSANVRLDFNAIAQGYTVDVVATFLETRGITRYLVEIGGEIRGRGEKQPGQPWTVGLENPRQPGRFQTFLPLRDRAVATSGTYRNHRTSGGAEFGHIINPRTGYAEPTDLVSVSVLAKDAMTADAYATAFMVMGLTATQRALTQHPELEAYLVYRDETGQVQTFTTEKGKNQK